MNLMLWVVTDIGLLLAGFAAGRHNGPRQAVEAIETVEDNLLEEETFLMTAVRAEPQLVGEEGRKYWGH